MIFIWVAIGVVVTLFVALCIFTLQLSKRLRLSEEKLSQQIRSLQHDLSVINSAAMGVGQRLMTTEKKLTVAIEKQQQFEMGSADYLPFNQAVAMVEDGADAEQLVDRCGLSEAEASLMALLNNKKKIVDVA